MKIRNGLRIKAHKVDKEIGQQFKLFAAWLRKKNEFPIRLPVYLSEKEYVVDEAGEDCVSIFFAPYDKNVEPYIRIATGDFYELVQDEGKEHAVFNSLFSLALAIIKYGNWLDNIKVDIDVIDAKATALLQSYIEDSVFDFK
jgi:hypothetical protein